MLLINRKYIVLLAIGIMALLQPIKAQEKTTVNGTVKDKMNGESIMGAII